MKFLSHLLEYIISAYNNLWAGVDGEAEEDSGKITNMDAIGIFFEDYIGLTILEFVTYYDDVEDIESDIQGKMIVGVKTSSDKLYLILNTATGKYAGRLCITPKINGSFVEGEPGAPPLTETRYRLNLYGSTFIEYVDLDLDGNITYSDMFMKSETIIREEE